MSSTFLPCLHATSSGVGYPSRGSTIWSDRSVPLSWGTLLRATAECQRSIQEEVGWPSHYSGDSRRKCAVNYNHCRNLRKKVGRNRDIFYEYIYSFEICFAIERIFNMQRICCLRTCYLWDMRVSIRCKDVEKIITRLW